MHQHLITVQFQRRRSGTRQGTSLFHHHVQLPPEWTKPNPNESVNNGADSRNHQNQLDLHFSFTANNYCGFIQQASQQQVK